MNRLRASQSLLCYDYEIGLMIANEQTAIYTRLYNGQYTLSVVNIFTICCQHLHMHVAEIIIVDGYTYWETDVT